MSAKQAFLYKTYSNRRPQSKLGTSVRKSVPTFLFYVEKYFSPENARFLCYIPFKKCSLYQSKVLRWTKKTQEVNSSYRVLFNWFCHFSLFDLMLMFFIVLVFIFVFFCVPGWMGMQAGARSLMNKGNWFHWHATT